VENWGDRQGVIGIPDNIRKILLIKRNALCFPSVLKAAFVIGGSYGRGAMDPAVPLVASISPAHGAPRR